MRERMKNGCEESDCDRKSRCGKEHLREKAERLYGASPVLSGHDLAQARPDRTTLSREEFERKIREKTAEDSWILDGNYLRTMKMRLAACDTVFYLDYPLEVCLRGAEARIGKQREDLPWEETEFDEEFRQWILDFPRDQKPRIDELLEKYRDGREIFIFHERKEAEQYLQTLEECRSNSAGTTQKEIGQKPIGRTDI